MDGVRGHGRRHPLHVGPEVAVQLPLLVYELDDAAGQTPLDPLKTIMWCTLYMHEDMCN